MREGEPMKKWSLLSIPLIGLASMSVWTQAVAGAPAQEFDGVVVRTSLPGSSVLNIDGFTKHPDVAPLGTPSASAQATSPSLKSAPLNPASSSPLPMATEQAQPVQPQETGAASGQDSGTVQLVEPTQITSPAVAPTSEAPSHVTLDGKGGVSGINGGSGGSSHD
jgi:hypothetical protein